MAQPHASLLDALEAACQGAQSRPGGNNVLALSMQARGDVDDDVVQSALTLFPCLR